MPTPTEHKTVQARILAYAQEVGWTLVSREYADARRGKNGGRECPPSLFFDDLLDAKVREFNPRYAEADGALLGKFPPSPRLRRTSRHISADIYGNPASPKGYGGTGREFVEHLRNPPLPGLRRDKPWQVLRSGGEAGARFDSNQGGKRS